MAENVELVRDLTVIEHAEIPLKDGTKLSAHIWMPADVEKNRVPAILEYLPYRKRDGTSRRDALNHPYFAAHGYAAVRVDMRGAGDSEGVLEGEYLKREQDDALEILQWIAGQTWCTGAIGMIGISWGGFNGLQIAARRPKELKAVISLCSTDDRYADDIHFMGGCLLVDKFTWGSTMFSINPTPPDPEVVGEKWRAMWMKRLENGGFYLEEWHHRQRRDDFYKHGSICEDYGAVQCPVFLVGGWMDGYTNTVFRMLKNLRCPRLGLVGPWAHLYPNFAQPGPRIGFLQECLRFWDKWLKGIETGIMDEPMLRAWMMDTVPPRTYYPERPGRWVAETQWPSPRITPRTFSLARGRLAEGASPGSNESLTISSPLSVGLHAGKWCAYGSDGDEPGDQRQEAGGSLIFETDPFEAPFDMLGAPLLRLRVAADRPNAMVAAVLSEVLPDGAATRLSFALLNLTHRDSHEEPEPLEPGQYYDVRLQLNECGQRISAGSRIRLALSSSYWPIAWPSPEKVTLSISTEGSGLELPVRPPSGEDAKLKPFAPETNAPALAATVLRRPDTRFHITEDVISGMVTVNRFQDDGLIRNNETGWEWDVKADRTYTIYPDDPLSPSVSYTWRKEYGRGDFRTAVQGKTGMTVSRGEFHLRAQLEAFEGTEQVFSREWSVAIPRDCV